MTMWCMCAAARVRSAAPARRSQLPMLAGASLATRLKGRSPRKRLEPALGLALPRGRRRQVPDRFFKSLLRIKESP